LPLFVPLVVVLVTLTGVVLVLLRKMSKGEPVEFRETIPNWIATGLAAELRAFTHLNAHEQLLAEGYFGRKLAEMRFNRATRSIPDEALSPPTVKARKLAQKTPAERDGQHDSDFEIGT
jgi:hypothetical protein